MFCLSVDKDAMLVILVKFEFEKIRLNSLGLYRVGVKQISKGTQRNWPTSPCMASKSPNSLLRQQHLSDDRGNLVKLYRQYKADWVFPLLISDL